MLPHGDPRLRREWSGDAACDTIVTGVWPLLVHGKNAGVLDALSWKSGAPRRRALDDWPLDVFWDPRTVQQDDASESRLERVPREGFPELDPEAFFPAWVMNWLGDSFLWPISHF